MKNIVNKEKDSVAEQQCDQKHIPEIIYPLDPILLAGIICALAGETETSYTADFFNNNRASFENCFSDLPKEPLTEDLVYYAFCLFSSDKFDAFHRHWIKPIVQLSHNKIEFGQTTQTSGNCLQQDAISNKSLIFNIRTADANISFTHRLPGEAFSSNLLDGLNIEGTVVFAGAFDCQADFAKAVIKGGADYCLTLNRANRTLMEASELFHSTPKSQILRYPNSSVSNSKRFGQIYYRILSGCLLPEPLQRKWSGLFYGAVIEGNFQKPRSSQSSRYFITSLPAKLNTIGKVNLYIENVL